MTINTSWLRGKKTCLNLKEQYIFLSKWFLVFLCFLVKRGLNSACCMRTYLMRKRSRAVGLWTFADGLMKAFSIRVESSEWKQAQVKLPSFKQQTLNIPLRNTGLPWWLGGGVKNLPPVWETWIWCLGQEDPLEEEMAMHCSTLAWRIHGQNSLVGYCPWGRKDWVLGS